MILGVDIGGTSVKFGIVGNNGEIQDYNSFDTNAWVASNGFVEGLKSELGNYLKKYPEVQGVGMGFPGLLSKERTHIILLPNIPSVKNVPILDILKKDFPGRDIRIENDAKCATIGEYFFGENKGTDNFLLITLGTGVGSGCIIDGKLFLGARGNGLELGHMLTNSNKTLEQQIGLNHIIDFTKRLLSGHQYEESLLCNERITPKTIYEAAVKGDKLSIAVFEHVGRLLGQTVVSAMRILDINKVLLGGGISGAFEFIYPQMLHIIQQYLPPYYTDNLIIKKASLSNFAGLLGAASLIMMEKANFHPLNGEKQ